MSEGRSFSRSDAFTRSSQRSSRSAFLPNLERSGSAEERARSQSCGRADACNVTNSADADEPASSDGDILELPAVLKEISRPFSQSLFRLLGIEGSSTLEAIKERWQLLTSFCPDGQLDNKAYELLMDSDLPWLMPERPSLEELRALEELINDPYKRLFHRAFWFHVMSPADQVALTALRLGEYGRAVEIWTRMWEDNVANKAFAAHNLALLYHTRAEGNPLGTAAYAVDAEEALRWWGHILDAGRLRTIAFHGEDRDVLEQEGFLEKETQYLEAWENEIGVCLLSLSSSGESSALRLNLEDGSSSLFEGRRLFGLSQESAFREKALRSIYMERAWREVRDGHSEEADYNFNLALQHCRNEQETGTVENVWSGLCMRLVTRGLVPVGHNVPLSPMRSYGLSLLNTDDLENYTRTFRGKLVFRFLFLPLWAMGYYRVRPVDKGVDNWDFISKYPSAWPIWLHNIIAVLLILCLIVAVGRCGGARFSAVADLNNRGSLSVADLTLFASDVPNLRVDSSGRQKRAGEIAMRLRECEHSQQLLSAKVEKLQEELDMVEGSEESRDMMRAKNLHKELSKLRERLRSVNESVKKLRMMEAVIVEIAEGNAAS